MIYHLTCAGRRPGPSGLHRPLRSSRARTASTCRSVPRRGLSTRRASTMRATRLTTVGAPSVWRRCPRSLSRHPSSSTRALLRGYQFPLILLKMFQIMFYQGQNGVESGLRGADHLGTRSGHQRPDRAGHPEDADPRPTPLGPSHLQGPLIR